MNREAQGVRIPRATWLCATIAFALLLLAAPAHAAFPGANGKIVFQRHFDIYTMNADGSGTTLVTGPITAGPDWQPLPGPSRSDFKNAAQFCRATRDFLGDAAFAKKYGTNGDGANAYGKCVSGK